MIEKKTVFSDDRVYRYTLWRDWDVDAITGSADDLKHPDKFVQFIGLNPSTADEVQDDPTIRRCIGFAKSWGYGALCMTNIFAFRATDPKVMKKTPDAAGHDNEDWILKIAREAGIVVAAWGNDGTHIHQGVTIKHMLKAHGIKVHHLGLTGTGEPKHPLYLRKDLKPIAFE